MRGLLGKRMLEGCELRVAGKCSAWSVCPNCTSLVSPAQSLSPVGRDRVWLSAVGVRVGGRCSAEVAQPLGVQAAVGGGSRQGLAEGV